MATPFRDYNAMYPQIYIYPQESSNTWRYLLFDPKDLERMHNNDFHKKLSTGLSLNTPLQEVVNHLHRKYPTATIDSFETEKEMLEQE